MGIGAGRVSTSLKRRRSGISREKVRQILRSYGIASPRKRRANKHRSRRERRAAEGMMLQVDGSPHDWLEGRGPSLCLIGAIDDATGKVVGAMFVEAESTWGYFRLFSEVFKKYGLPQSVYADRHSIFWTDREPTLEEQLKNQRPSTEVGRGLQELGVTLIPAGSPQAKGRIERLWGTFQARLVSEHRRARAKTPSQAQVVLERYPPEHNRKFSKPALSEPAWRKASSTQIQRALCFKQKRTVAKDHTVTFEGTLFQIPKPSPSRPTPISESMCMCCWTVRWSFSTKMKKSLALTPTQRTQLAYIERSASGKGSAMDLFRHYRLKHSNCHPDIFTLPLP